MNQNVSEALPSTFQKMTSALINKSLNLEIVMILENDLRESLFNFAKIFGIHPNQILQICCLAREMLVCLNFFIINSNNMSYIFQLNNDQDSSNIPLVLHAYPVHPSLQRPIVESRQEPLNRQGLPSKQWHRLTHFRPQKPTGQTITQVYESITLTFDASLCHHNIIPASMNCNCCISNNLA